MIETLTQLYYNVVYWQRRFRYSVFGATLTSTVVSVDGGCVSEEKFSEGSEVVGYWAYGHYDPNYPYIGQKKVTVC